MEYFSEGTEGKRPRNREDINEIAWGGIRALLKARIEDGSMGASYPESCSDGGGPYATDVTSFWEAMRAEIPTLGQWAPWYANVDRPATTEILDMLQFGWRSVGKPIRKSFHSFPKHYHLDYDRDAGRIEFRDDVNRILSRNGLAYELLADGNIRRIVPAILGEELATTEFNSGDQQLDLLLESARRKFLDPHPAIRREALEKLWDAWERVKTLGTGAHKKAQTADMLDRAAAAATGRFRQALEAEAREVTDIGNTLQIRHSETTQEPLRSALHVDYLFHRLFALLVLVIRSQKSGA